MVNLKNRICDTREDCAKPSRLLICAKNVLKAYFLKSEKEDDLESRKKKRKKKQMIEM